MYVKSFPSYNQVQYGEEFEICATLFETCARMLLMPRQGQARGETMRTAAFGSWAALMAVMLLLASASVAQVSATGFEYDDQTGLVSGEFVSFVFQEDTMTGAATLSDYSLGDGLGDGETVKVFDVITIENFSGTAIFGQQILDTQVVTVGAVWAAIGANASVKALDNPVGNLAIANVGLSGAPPGYQGDIGQIGDFSLAQQFLDAQNTITFQVNTDMQVSWTGEVGTRGGYVNITGVDFRGFIFVSNGTVDIDGNTVTVVLKGPQATFFHGLPLFGMGADEMEFESEVAEATARTDVGARIDIGPGGEVVKSAFRTSFQLTPLVVEQNRVSLQLESSMTEGAIIVVYISGQVIDLSREIAVKLEGQEVGRATSLEVLIDTKSMGEATPKVYLVKTTDELMLSIYVPHFSERTLTVEALEPAGLALGDFLSNPTFWIVVGIASAIIIMGAIAAARRRK